MTNLIDSSDDMDTTGKKKLNTAMQTIPQNAVKVETAAALDSSGYITVDIGGVSYKLALAEDD